MEKLLLIFLASILAACATKPTVAIDSIDRRQRGDQVEANAIPKIDEKTIVLDARPAFLYSMAHIPRSISLRWEDFTEPVPDQSGVLQRDLFAITRRLARLGISPESKVVVVGAGLQGAAEEWRVAWMLRYLGVQDVRAIPLEEFNLPLTTQTQASPPAGNIEVPLWKPVTMDSLLVTREELLNVINAGGVYRPIPPPGKSNAVKTYKIIDVRSPREYIGKEGLALTSPIPNIEAINIEWKEFFTREGISNREIASHLQQVGITPENRVIVLSENGLRSSAVTLALSEMGYTDVGNSAGGLRDLLAGYQKPSKKSKRPRRK